MSEPPVTLATLSEKAKSHSSSSIFAQFPADQTKTLKDGSEVAVPYHSYGADGLIIWGEADVDWVKGKIKGPWSPLLGTNGKAQVAVWVVDYKDTVLNPYKELIVVFSVVPSSEEDKVAPVEYPRMILPMFDDKQAFPYIYKLWLDKKLPTDYGRELLGCDKYLDPAMTLDFTSTGEWSYPVQCDMEFHHVEGELNDPTVGHLLKGTLKLADGMGLGRLIGAYGFFRTLGMAAGAAGSWHVVNPPGIMEGEGATKNPVFDFYYETSPKFTLADPDAPSSLEYGGELKEMHFKEISFQHDPNLRAVLLEAWHYEDADGTRPVKKPDVQVPKKAARCC